MYLSLQCHHQNDSCIKMGSDESILMFYNCEGQSHKTVSTDHNFWRERRAEADSNRSPCAYQPNALPLGSFHSHISTRTFRRALTASVDSCAEIKSAPHSGVTKSGRVWRKVPESDAGSVWSCVSAVRHGQVYSYTSIGRKHDEILCMKRFTVGHRCWRNSAFSLLLGFFIFVSLPLFARFLQDVFFFMACLL